MRIASAYLFVLGVFAVVIGTIYWFVSYEPTGTVMLAAIALMMFVIVGWMWRRGELRGGRPEDRPDADPSDAAGEEIGEFASSSAWPSVLVLGVIIVGLALIYGLILAPIGGGLMAWAIVGMIRESR